MTLLCLPEWKNVWIMEVRCISRYLESCKQKCDVNYRRWNNFTNPWLLSDGPDLVNVPEGVLKLLPGRLEHGCFWGRNELELWRGHLDLSVRGHARYATAACWGVMARKRQRDEEGRKASVPPPPPDIYYWRWESRPRRNTLHFMDATLAQKLDLYTFTVFINNNMIHINICVCILLHKR